MESEIYRQLQRHLDHSPVPFPETDSGVEISLLRKLFDETEANIALKLSAVPESIERIFGRFQEGEISKETLQAKLEGLLDKGAIYSKIDEKRGRLYQKAPLAVGMYELQVDQMTKELAEDYFQYEDEGFAEAIIDVKTRQMRTIPVHIGIETEFLIGSYDNARAIIDNSQGPFRGNELYLPAIQAEGWETLQALRYPGNLFHDGIFSDIHDGNGSCTGD